MIYVTFLILAIVVGSNGLNFFVNEHSLNTKSQSAYHRLGLSVVIVAGVPYMCYRRIRNESISTRKGEKDT